MKESKERRLDEMCKMVMRQTNYTYEESTKLLIESRYNYMKVIQDYIGASKQEENIKNKNTVNQMIYKELRTFMDVTAEQYEKRKFQAERLELLRQQILQENAKKQNEESGDKQEDKQE